MGRSRQSACTCPHCHQNNTKDDANFSSNLAGGVGKMMDSLMEQTKSTYCYVTSAILVVGILFLVAYLMYLVVEYKCLLRWNDDRSMSAIRYVEPVEVFNVVPQDFCTVISKELYALEQIGYVDPDRRVSKLMALDVRTTDVHYVFMNDTQMPWLSMCSLESALGAIGDRGRVNVFLVYGAVAKADHDRHKRKLGFPPILLLQVQLSASLEKLTTTYGERLNVLNIDLDDCLDCSPFRGMKLVNNTALAKFAVELVLLWQFGGTVLDAGLVVVRGDVYRASGTAVEYGDREISSPAACKEFIYNAMLCTINFVNHVRKPFDAHACRKIVDKTVERFRYSAKDAQPLNEQVVCKNGVVADYCYYVEADRLVHSDKSYMHGFCPVMSNVSLPWLHKMILKDSTAN
ncbi:uncharacterized protein LOC126839322 [Adelges cooleyi]|uniref:uncharacterized protein LOC126839322 n=1 Tax=Adelges cooleyi TaxID=133065 RepID=UPI002180546C|nr:uncharacterized protein LOC126839322 [Adelges cooleyi]